MALCLALATLCWTSPSRAEGTAYDAAVEAGVQAFARHDYDEARRQFEASHALEPSARTHRGLGMVHFELREYEVALVHLRASLTDTRRPLTDEYRAHVADLIERTLTFLGFFELSLFPLDATLTVDGLPPVVDGSELWLRVGRRTLRLSAPGFRSVTRLVDVQGNERGGLRLELEPGVDPPVAAAGAGVGATAATATSAAPASAPAAAAAASQGGQGRAAFPWGPVALMAGGGAMVVASIVTGSVALATESDLEQLCPAGQCAGDDEPKAAELAARGRALSIATDVLLFGGIGVAAGGLTWLLLSGRRESPPLTAMCHLDGCSARVDLQF